MGHDHSDSDCDGYQIARGYKDCKSPYDSTNDSESHANYCLYQSDHNLAAYYIYQDYNDIHRASSYNHGG